MIFPQNTTDATIQAAQIAAHHPDYVYFNTVGAFDAIFGNELLDLGFKPEQLVRSFGITTGIKSWGPRAVGSIYGTFFDKGIDNLNDAGRAFISAFTAANNRPPSYVENFCYTTPFVFKAAIEAAGSTDRKKLRDAISALVVPERTTGKIIRFDQNGARTGYGYFMRLTGQSQNDYQSKQLSYMEWSPEEIPVYDIVK
jgi:ABC-type branched-subunit amino acid transport system substrate-binding protein